MTKCKGRCLWRCLWNPSLRYSISRHAVSVACTAISNVGSPHIAVATTNEIWYVISIPDSVTMAITLVCKLRDLVSLALLVDVRLAHANKWEQRTLLFQLMTCHMPKYTHLLEQGVERFTQLCNQVQFHKEALPILGKSLTVQPKWTYSSVCSVDTLSR